MLALEDRFELRHGVLPNLRVAHARVHPRHLAALQRLALARHVGGDGDVDLPVHPAQGVVLAVVEAEELLLHHADDLVAGAADDHRLPDRVVGGEELRGALAAEDDHARRRGHVAVGDEAALVGVEVVHRRVGRGDPHDRARLLDVAVANGGGLVADGRDEVDVLGVALEGHDVGPGQAARGQRLRVERDLPRRLVVDPDLLDAAADGVELHRLRLAGHGERERGHDRCRAENDPGELQQRPPEVLADVADAVEDGFEEDHG